MTQASEPGFEPTPPALLRSLRGQRPAQCRIPEMESAAGLGGGAEPASAQRLRDGAAAGKRDIHQAADPGAPALCGG